MEYLWPYLALGGAFSAGWMTCVLLSRRKIEVAERRAENLKKLVICVANRSDKS